MRIEGVELLFKAERCEGEVAEGPRGPAMDIVVVVVIRCSTLGEVRAFVSLMASELQLALMVRVATQLIVNCNREVMASLMVAGCTVSISQVQRSCQPRKKLQRRPESFPRHVTVQPPPTAI